MNWEELEGTWEHVKGDVKRAWGKLTDDDLMYVKGHRDRLVGKIHERYGTMKEQAYKDIDTWVAKLENSIDRAAGKAPRDSVEGRAK